MRSILLLVLFSWCLTPFVRCEETIIVGHIFDSFTGENIPNANIYFQGTKIGTTSNDEGLFILRADVKKKVNLVVSSVGYKKQRFSIEPGQSVGLEVEMQEQTIHLGEVFALPGKNPALPIIDSILAHTPSNDITQQETSFTVQEETDLFISDISQKHLQRQLWKSLQAGMLQREDSTYILPLYQSTQSFARQAEKVTIVTPLQEQATFLTETNYQVLLGGLPTTLNFYENILSIYNKSFVSPIGRFGKQHYDYYLQDENVAAGTYRIRFKTKNPFEVTFNGEMVIDSLTYALQSIQVTVPREVNVNYLSSLQLQQTYRTDNTLEKESLSMIFDFAVKADTSKIFPTILLTRHQIQDKGQRMKDEEKRTKDEGKLSIINYQLSTEKMAALDSLPLVQFVKWFAYIFHTGEVRMGKDNPVNVGNVIDIVAYSKHEGFHLGVPLATNEHFSKHVRLNGHVGYGFHDRAWKYQLQAQFKLPTNNRHIFGTYYMDRYVESDLNYIDHDLRENLLTNGNMEVAYSLLRGWNSFDGALPTAARKREFKVFAQNEWSDNIETEFSFQMGRMGYGDPMVGYHEMPSYQFRNVVAGIRLGWDERKVDIHFRRVHLYSSKPVVRAWLEGGSFQFDGAEQEQLYGKVAVAVQQNAPLGICGHLDYCVEAGYTFGKVPYPLLKTFSGNNSWVFEPYRFSLMSRGHFAADKYLTLHAVWNMEGALLSRIPGIRYLRLHELLELKMAWGGLSNGHYTLGRELRTCAVPYVEAGIGLGNILRFGEAYFVSRLTNFHDTTMPIMGFRFRIKFGV